MQTNMFLVMCFFSATIILNADFVISENIVDYYTNLIQNKTNSASLYVVPDNAYSHKPTSNSVTEYGTYDYIIIGAGSAGSVIASRLSEIKSNKVLLLEAGGEEDDFVDIPAMLLYLQGTDYNWNYTSTRQHNNCLGTVNQACPYPRGKGLGGSSLINACMYARGNKIDFDFWQALGNPGWSYNDVLPYFIKSENSYIPGDSGYHGKGGYLDITHSYPISKQASVFIDANIELGKEYVDYNGEKQLGVSRIQHTMTTNGRRLSIAKAFLKPAENRKNLDIQEYAYVMKINIDTITKQTVGILFVVAGKLYSAKVNKEVILSAGTIGSPQLLMLSGIGPPDHLKKFNIPVIQSLAVGSNLQDHATYYPLNFRSNYTEPIKSMQEYVKEYLNGVGPYTKPGSVEAVGFFQTNLNMDTRRPDIEMLLITSNNSGPIFRKAFNLDDETYNSIWAPAIMNPVNSFSINILLLHPKSRGYIKLLSSNPFEHPEINPKFYMDPNNQDMETMYRGIQLALELLTTNSFKKISASLINASHPRCLDYKHLSREYWYCQIKQLGFHTSHPVGTCKMGPTPQKGAVVDHKLKVHGIKGLRVADCSIVPQAPSGHTGAIAVMIGEKLAQMIKDED